MPDIRMKDGTIIRNVPEGTPREEVLRRWAVATRKTSAPGAFVRGAADGATLGWADELGGYIRALASPASVEPYAMGQQYGAARDDIRANMAADAARHPGARFAGQVGGALAVPTPAAPFAASAKLAPRLLGRAAVNAPAGFIYGAGSGDGSVNDRLRSGAKGATAAVIGGEAGRKGMQVVGAAVRGARRTPAAQRLVDRGIRTTLGQSLGGRAKGLEDRLAGFSVVGSNVRQMRRDQFRDLAEATINEALDPVSEGAADYALNGRELVAAADDAANAAYGASLRAIRVQPDDKFLSAVEKLRSSGLSKAQRQELAALIDEDVLPRIKDGQIDGESIQAIKEVLDGEIKTYSNAAGGRTMANALKAFREDVLGLIDRASPDAAEAYRNARQAYGNMAIVKKASEKSTSDGYWTPFQLAQSVRQNARGSAYSRGEANMQALADDAMQVLPRAVPDPGTAGQMEFWNFLTKPSMWPKAAGSMALGIPYSRPGNAIVQGALFGRSPRMVRAGEQLQQIAPPFGTAAGLLAVPLTE